MILVTFLLFNFVIRACYNLELFNYLDFKLQNYNCHTFRKKEVILLLGTYLQTDNPLSHF